MESVLDKMASGCGYKLAVANKLAAECMVYFYVTVIYKLQINMCVLFTVCITYSSACIESTGAT